MPTEGARNAMPTAPLRRMFDWLQIDRTPYRATVAWLIVLAGAALHFVGLEDRPGLGGYPAWPMIGWLFTALLVLSVPAVRAWTGLSRPAQVALVGAAGLALVSLISSLLGPLPVVVTSQEWPVPRGLLVAPMAAAVVAMLAAIFGALLVPPGIRQRVFSALAWATAVAGALAWVRQVLTHHTLRAATAMGGSAVIHVVFLVAGGVFLDRWRTTRHWSDLVCFAWCMVLLIGTGSRAGVVCLMLFVVLSLGSALWRHEGRRVWLFVAAGALAVVAALAAFVPSLARLFNFSDEKRSVNAATAWTAWLQSPLTGVGSGRLWPSAAFDTGLVPVPGAGLHPTPWGDALLSPHSTVLYALAELGAVGLLTLGLVTGGMVWAWVRRPRHRAATITALVATLPAHLFDTYLVRNLTVSFFLIFIFVLTQVGTTDKESPA